MHSATHEEKNTKLVAVAPVKFKSMRFKKLPTLCMKALYSPIKQSQHMFPVISGVEDNNAED